MVSPSLCADAIVIIHVAYVAFVVLAVPVILIGGLCKVGWVRNPWFRNIHVLMIGIVVAEALLGIPCPLTVWENQLRTAEGQESYSRSFVGEAMHNILFYDFEPWVFTLGYCAFGALVVGAYVLYPPRCWSRKTAA